jgi:transcriptional regulator with XRE-family HTH domain
MTTAEAILRLRSQLALTQPEFAAAARMSLRSLCRFEKGVSPSIKTLMGLADLARASNIPHLHAIFEALLQGDLVTQAERQQRKLRSTGSARRINFDQLMRWAQAADEARRSSEIVSKLVDLKTKSEGAKGGKTLVDALRTVQETVIAGQAAAESILDDVVLYLLGPGPASADRLQAIDCVLHPEVKGPRKSRELIDRYIAGPTAKDNATRLKEGMRNVREQFASDAKASQGGRGKTR